MKTLFVCRGNVGRSQIAEALFRKRFPEAEVSSAGIKISGPEQPIGELVPQIQEVLDVMNKEGIDVSGAVRKQLTEQMVKDADKVIVIIEDGEILPEYLSHSSKLIRWNVADPKGMNLELTRKVKDQIKSLIDSIRQ
ncbi:MAG: hypothetical protein WC763_01720 [Candidatus Paceibacterota bacterium]|jgi:protein-tyrosine-phosphatase